MQRLAYVCASCRRSLATRTISRPSVRRQVHSATAPNNKAASKTQALSSKRKRITSRPLLTQHGAPENSSYNAWKPFRNDTNSDSQVTFQKSRSKRSQEFYKEVDSSDAIKLELDNLSRRLARDDYFLSRAYTGLEGILQSYGTRYPQLLRNILRDHRLPRQIINKLIEYRDKIEDLPSMLDVLKKFAECGCNDDILWADVMFEYIRTEFYDDAIDLWRMRSDYERIYPQSFQEPLLKETPSQLTPSNDANTSTETDMKPSPLAYESKCYAAVAAITAFLSARRLLMMRTNLSDLLHFVAPEGGKISQLIPATFAFGYILKENNISPAIVESTLNALRDFRPYSDNVNIQQRSLLDRAFLAASDKDLEALRWIYAESKKEIPVEERRRGYYICFINAFMQCGSRIDGDVIWQDMLQAGIMPSAKVWSSWLDGCAKARDIELFQEGWTRMIGEMVAPDNVCWTIRMQMHFLLEDTEGAKLCLQGMVDNGVLINTNTLNVAINGLNDAKLYNDIDDLMRWALQHGVQPDTVTYNLILDSRVKMNDFNGVLKVLDTMNKSGIPTDIISYGVIIRGLYHTSDTPPDIQIVKTVLEEMKAKEISPNLQFYNTIINGMLNKFFDIKGALYILSLMPNDAWRGSSHTSTLFIQYYSKTGNISGIETVWANMRRNAIAPDEYVYNVTVRAYARAGLKDKMLEYLGLMTKLRKRLTIVGYISVLKCLIQQHDFLTAQQIFSQMHSRKIDIFENKELAELYRRLKDGLVTNPRDRILDFQISRF
ncbi:hypothetical protein ABW19_dt0207432 [Dactylella cylindrospora]|nr:hypothetical protein ABW19_dt0207432 [Dactylella cylindrospora]